MHIENYRKVTSYERDVVTQRRKERKKERKKEGKDRWKVGIA